MTKRRLCTVCRRIQQYLTLRQSVVITFVKEDGAWKKPSGLYLPNERRKGVFREH
jgi:hypothetical protein